MKAITADSIAGRVLQALRAPPGMTVTEAWERWPSTGTKPLCDLQRAGLVANDGDVYTLTEAGRAACPSRNPLAAKPATPEVFTMPKGETKLHRQQVLDFIVAAGPDGTSRKALMEKFGHLVVSSAIDNHISDLHNAYQISKPRPGWMIASQFRPAFNAPDYVPEMPAPADWIPEPLATDQPAAHDIHGVSLAVDHQDVGDLSAEGLAAQMRLIDGPRAVAAPGEKARYALLFESEFHETIEGAIADAVRDYELDSLKAAVIVACTPLGRIDVRPVFVPEAA